MKRLCILIVCTWLTAGAGAAHAQLFFNPFRKAPPAVPPAERVGQLVTTIKSDPDERKRVAAVEELRDFDSKSFPQIVDILADIAQNDSKAGVRGEAVSSLVRMRPVSPIAGQAIENAASKDDNWRNRMNAQAALVRYRLAGYSPSAARNDGKPPAPPSGVNQSGEPPLASQAPPPGNPPIIYHDHTGKVIPAPKGYPTNSVPAPQVIGTPTSNPGNGVRSPFAPIGPAPVAPPTTPPVSRYTPPSVPQFAPPIGQVGQPVPQPLAKPQANVPVAIEPTFRAVNKAVNREPGPLVLTPPPPAPAPVPVNVPVNVPTPTPAQGPSLDLPPLPINSVPAPAPTPAPAAGPSLETSAVSSLPAGRMDPSPRLSPVTP
jgi:hypothetical protein